MATYILAITGASGVGYGLKLLEELLKRGDDVHLIISPSGFLLLEQEAGIMLKGKEPEKEILGYLKKTNKGKGARGFKGTLSYTPSNDISSGLASGSSLKKEMIICPASMGTIGRIASGISGNLIERAADCVLKEGGRLVVVPRETPLNSIHLENMLKLKTLGVTVLPAMPGFYHKPQTMEDIVNFIVGKILDSLGIENDLYKRWKAIT